MVKNQIQHMGKDSDKSAAGQALVEFALIISFVLVFAFIIIESGRLFQAWQTVQNAAREAGRYALTGQYDPSCLSASPACLDPRVHSIQQRSLSAATGLVIDHSASYNDPNYFFTEVISLNPDGSLRFGDAGRAGEPVYIRVTYRMGLITPVLSSIFPSVRVTGSVTVNNEDFDQTGLAITNPSGPPGGINPPPPGEFLPDLELDKVSLPLSVSIGENIDYRLTVRNRGNALAPNVVLTDTLPAEVTILSIPNLCAHEGNLVTCALGDMEVNSQLQLTIQVQAPISIYTNSVNFINSAIVTTTAFEDIVNNNTDTATTEVISEGSDLRILDVSSVPYPVTAGQIVSLNVTARNDGPDLPPATNTVLTTTFRTDLMPFAGFTSSKVGTDCTPEDTADEVVGIISCELGSMSRYEEVELSLNFATDEDLTAVTVFFHQLGIRADQYDRDLNNNRASVETRIVPSQADLRISKTSTPSSVMQNESVTYLIQVTNLGPAIANNIVVTDTLPAGTTFVSASSNCETPPQNGILICRVASLPPSGINTANMSVIVRSPEGTAPLVNRVVVRADEPDPNLNNNVAEVTTLIEEADLALEMSTNSTSATEGVPVDFNMIVTNYGPSPASGVSVFNTLDPTFQYISATPSRGFCFHGGGSPGGTLTCNLGSMASETSATITLRIIPTVGGTGQGDPYTNSATVAANEGDPKDTNNEDSVTIIVRNATSPFITLTPSCGDPGGTIQINGYNFTKGNPRTVTIYLRLGTTNIATYVLEEPKGETWTDMVTLPTDLQPNQNYTVLAVQQGQNDATAALAVPCPKPDLVISNLQLGSSQPITTHTPLTFTATIENVGSLAAVNQFFVSLYLNPLNVDTGTTHINSSYRLPGAIVGVSGLGVGASRVVTFTAVTGLPELGSHQIYAVADSDPSPTGMISELNEANNIAGPLVVSASYTATLPPPSGTITTTGSLVGFTFAPQPGSGPIQQPFTPIFIYDTNNALVASGTSRVNGYYEFLDLPIGFYNVAACITLDGSEYFALLPGVEILMDQPTLRYIYLERTACWPTP